MKNCKFNKIRSVQRGTFDKRSLYRLVVRTLPFHGNDMGSNPIRDIRQYARRQLTQLVECFAYNEEVSGSNPLLFIKKLIFKGVVIG